MGEELGPAAAYSAQVAAWLQQAYHAQMLQYGENKIWPMSQIKGYESK